MSDDFQQFTAREIDVFKANYQLCFPGCGPHDLLNLILVCFGEKTKDKEAKVSTAKTLWISAANHHGGFDRWMFHEIRDPCDTQDEMRAALIKEKG